MLGHDFAETRLDGTTDLALRHVDPITRLPSYSPYVSIKGVLGHEWNEDIDNSHRPAGLIRLSRTRVDSVQYLMDHGGTFDAGSAWFVFE